MCVRGSIFRTRPTLANFFHSFYRRAKSKPYSASAAGRSIRNLWLKGVESNDTSDTDRDVALCPEVCLAQTKGNPDDEAAIKKLFAKSRESVEKGDADLRASLYTENAVFYNAFGVEREGREAIREFWKAIFASGTFSKSTFKFTKEKIRFVRPDVAVVDIFEEVTGQRQPSTGKEVPTRYVHLTFIMTKKGNEWYFAYYRAGDLRTDSIR